MKVAQRDRAFTLFCNGKTLAEAAEIVGVHRSTAERWSKEFCWRIHRKRVWNETREQIIKERSSRFAYNEIFLSEKLHRMIAEVCAERRAYQEGRLPKRALKNSTNDLLNLSKACINASALIFRKFGEE